MKDKLIEERSSEDMSMAQRSSLAVAEKGPFPIQSVQEVLRAWRPEKLKVVVKRRMLASRAVDMCRCEGSRSERARSGRRYGSWAKISSPKKI
jgi:hypothetical protein